MTDFSINLDDINFIGSGLHRPECVFATADGSVYAADWRGGVTRIGPDGGQTTWLGQVPGRELKPNGAMPMSDGGFLIACLGEGGLWSLHPRHGLKPLLTELGGKPIPPSNYAVEDDKGRFWLTVSTRREPRNLGYCKDIDDGFIVLIDEKGARIVADGIGYTNEIVFSADGNWLFVNETFVRRTSRYRLAPDGSLSDKEVVTEYGAGIFPDGLCFDSEDHLWITSIVSNRVIRVAPDGSQSVILEDSDADHLAWVEEAYQNDELGRPHLDGVKSKRLQNISSLAFGGPDMKTVYLGCLLGDSIGTFRSPVAGREPLFRNFMPG